MRFFRLVLVVCVFSGPLFLFSKEDRVRTTLGPPIRKVSHFQGIPLAEESGLVVKVKTIHIPKYPSAYNPAIIQKGDHYLLAFRHDLPWRGSEYKKVQLGIVETDSRFHPIDDPVLLETGNWHSPDPRLFYHDGTLFITYTHLTLWGPPYECCIGVSSIDPKTLKSTMNFDLQYKRGPREKNWVPFTYMNDQKEEELYFVYDFNPMTVLKIQKPITGAIEQIISSDMTNPTLDAWEKKWGKIRGGTTPILSNGEYVCFFHSSFQEQSLYWYVFGAITFDGKPPFSVKRISPHPILFKGMYQSLFAPQRNTIIRAVFPSGLVEDIVNKRSVFQVFCGENDSAIKMVTIDKDILLQSLQTVE